MVASETRSRGRHQLLVEYRHTQPRTVADWLIWSILSVWFIWLIWFNQINETNKINRIDKKDQTDLTLVFCSWRRMDLRGFCQQDARDMEVSKHDFRVSIEGLVVGSFESVAFNRRAGQAAHLGHKVFDVFMGDVERIVV